VINLYLGVRRRNAEVIPLPAKVRPDPFKQLTAKLVIAQYREGTLPEAVLLALMACAGLQP
jgi:hypothetical protein